MSALDIGRCLGDVELTRAVAGHANDRERAHLDRCARCASEASAYRKMIELARRIEPSPASRDRHEQLRTELLAMSALGRGAPAPRRGARAWQVAAAGFAVAAALLVIVTSARTRGPSSPAPTTTTKEIRRGTVTAHPDAFFHLAGSQPDEIVRLTDGIIHVQVEPLAVGERFRVLTGDGEAEVRGTAFDVTARADHLIAVHVDHGLVEVRLIDGPMVVLGAGERWDAPTVAVESATTVMPPGGPPTVPSTRPKATDAERHRRAQLTQRAQPAPTVPPSAPARSPAEQAFSDGWDALRRENAATAASLFEQCLAGEPAGALAEDASFWHGVALSRAGRSAGATRALVGFLDAYPRSARAGEASMMLGWLLLDDGDIDGAERRFAAAKDDLSSTVRASVAEGLAEVARRRH